MWNVKCPNVLAEIDYTIWGCEQIWEHFPDGGGDGMGWGRLAEGIKLGTNKDKLNWKGIRDWGDKVTEKKKGSTERKSD